MRAAAAIIACGVAGPCLGDVTVAFRSAVELGAAATDQNGAAFTVAELSGITRLSDGRYAAVMDGSNKIVFLSLGLGTDGALTSATVSGGLTLSVSRDYEDLCPLDAGRVLLCEESAAALLRTADLASGVTGNGPALPAVFTNVRSNKGIESLTRTRDDRLWVCNEEALSVDGPISTPSAGTRVRLQRMDPAPGGGWIAGPQYCYLTEPMHGSSVTDARSGVSALCALPDGSLLALERSFAFNLSGVFRTRIYQIDFAGATETSAAVALNVPGITPVGKRLLYSGNQNNLEGLCLGPRLGAGAYALLGVTDDGDPISTNRVVSFLASGVACGPADLGRQGGLSGADGLLDNNDFVVFIDAFFALDARADMGRQGGLAGHDGLFDNNDFVVFITEFFAGCGV